MDDSGRRTEKEKSRKMSQDQLEEGGEQGETQAPRNTLHMCVFQKQPGWGKMYTTVPKQQKDQGTVWRWQTAMERLKTLNAVCAIIKGRLGEVQTKAGNYNCRLG